MMLDTNAPSAWADGDSALLRALPKDRLWHIPVVVLGEFSFGIRRSRDRSQLERWLGEVKLACVLVGIDAETAEHYAEIREELRIAATPIPENDIWIAAICLDIAFESGIRAVLLRYPRLLAQKEPAKDHPEHGRERRAHFGHEIGDPHRPLQRVLLSPRLRGKSSRCPQTSPKDSRRRLGRRSVSSSLLPKAEVFPSQAEPPAVSRLGRTKLAILRRLNCAQSWVIVLRAASWLEMLVFQCTGNRVLGSPVF